MATVKQYMGQMRAAERAVGRKMGVDLAHAGKELRVAMLAVTAMIAVLMRALFVAGVITDAQLQAALDAAAADVYDPEPLEPPEDVG